jgi:hypothetical protein
VATRFVEGAGVSLAYDEGHEPYAHPGIVGAGVAAINGVTDWGMTVFCQSSVGAISNSGYVNG